VIILDLSRDLWWTSNDLVNMHRMAVAKKSRAVRALAAVAARQSGQARVERCRLVVTASIPTARRFDPANIAGTVSKHAIDGFTDAGLWADDDSDHVQAVTFQRGAKTSLRGIYRLTFDIEEVA
jgi:crossover junction endodeoxyribonuclease RusA